MLGRIRAIPGRTKFFIVLAVALAILGFAGVINAARDVNLEREEAVEIALDHVDFEPETADARLIRQGFSLEPVWAVSLAIPQPNNPREFVRLTIVEIDARTGEIRSVRHSE